MWDIKSNICISCSADNARTFLPNPPAGHGCKLRLWHLSGYLKPLGLAWIRLFFFFSFGVRGSGRKLGCKKYIGSYPALPLQGYQQAHPLNGEKHSSFCRATAHVFLTHLTSLASEYTWSITLHTSVTGSNFSVKFICVLSVPKIKVRSLGSWSSETVRGHISQICLLRTV